MKFTVEQSTSHPGSELKSRVEELFKRFSTKFGAKYNWQPDGTVSWSAMGAKGKATLGVGKVEVEVDLSASPMLAPMRPMIEGALKQELKVSLG